MNADIIREIEEEQKRKEEFEFNTGDTVRVHNKIREGNRER
ncbi:MAG TPA: 50S ribosomal protein L19, partial [Lachnospiraceae bacterium]|nr:50S ribosomal protein L19 [Lachnospiraceae bacterium]